MWRSKELVLFFHFYMGSGTLNQATCLGYKQPVPAEQILNLLTIQNSYYKSTLDLLNDCCITKYCSEAKILGGPYSYLLLQEGEAKACFDLRCLSDPLYK